MVRNIKLSFFILAMMPLPLMAQSDAEIITKDDVAYCAGLLTAKNDVKKDMSKVVDDGSVWQVGNTRWSSEWEKKYSDWMASNVVDVNFMTKYDLQSDCTDAAVIKRAIFARLNNLPVLFLALTFRF